MSTETQQAFSAIREKIAEMEARYNEEYAEHDRAVRSRQWDEANITKPFMARSGFQQRYCGPVRLTAEQQALFNAASSKMGQGAIMAFIGPRGHGKTTVAAQIARKFAAKGVIVPYRKLDAITADLLPLYSGKGTIHLERIERTRDWLTKVPLLILDELHESVSTPFAMKTLVDLCDRRYSALTDTIVISNQTVREFQESMDESVMSRLKQHGFIKPCEWEDMRK